MTLEQAEAILGMGCEKYVEQNGFQFLCEELRPGVKLYGTYKQVGKDLEPIAEGYSWDAVKEQLEEDYVYRTWNTGLAATTRFAVRCAEIEQKRERDAEQCLAEMSKTLGPGGRQAQ